MTHNETTEGNPPAAVPLTEMLRSIPRDARLTVGDECRSSTWPIGILANTAADEIERLSELVSSLKAELEGAAHNRFYDQRDAYFEGLADAKE